MTTSSARTTTAFPTWSTSTCRTSARSSARTSSPPAAARGTSSMPRSLRWRLLAWQATILLVVVVGFGAALYLEIRKARLDEIDAELIAAARVIEGELRVFAGKRPEKEPRGPPPKR